MEKVATNITLDEDVKKKAQAMLADFGLDLYFPKAENPLIFSRWDECLYPDNTVS